MPTTCEPVVSLEWQPMFMSTHCIMLLLCLCFLFSTYWLPMHNDLLTSFLKLGMYSHILPKNLSFKFIILIRLSILIERPNRPLKQCLSNFYVNIHHWGIHFTNTDSDLDNLKRDIKFYISNTLLGDVDSVVPWTPFWVARSGHKCFYPHRHLLPNMIQSSFPLKPFHWVLMWDLQIPSILNLHSACL